jgi:heterodisulfide reductase subunit C
LKEKKEKNIQNDSKDPNFCNEVIETGSQIFPKEELTHLSACLQCGNCVGGCPSGKRTAWRIRKIFRETLLGEKEKVLSDDDLWNCTTCYTCQERCPRGVPSTDIVRILRNLAVRNGNMKDNHKKVCEILLKYGHAVPVNEQTKKNRKELGLDELPPTVHSYPEGLKEVLMLFEKTVFKELVEDKEN